MLINEKAHPAETARDNWTETELAKLCGSASLLCTYLDMALAVSRADPQQCPSLCWPLNNPTLWEMGSFKAAHHWGKTIYEETPGFCHKSCLLLQFKIIHNGTMWWAILHTQIRQIKTATACLHVRVRTREIGMTWHYPHTQKLITKLLRPQQLLWQDLVPSEDLRGPTWSLTTSRQNQTIQSAEASFLQAAHNSQTGRGWDDPAANQRGGRGKSPWPKTWPEVATFSGTLVAAGSAGDSSQFSTKVSDRGHKNHVSVPTCHQRNVHRQVLRPAGKNNKYKWRFDETGVSSLMFYDSI